MPKGTRKSGRVATGQTNFGKMGMSSESDVFNSKGKAVSGNPKGDAARRMVGDKGVAAHEKAVKKSAKRVASGKEGSYERVNTTAKGAKAPKKKVAPAKKTKVKK